MRRLSTLSVDVDVFGILKEVRVRVAAPVLWVVALACLVMSVMLLVDVLFLSVVSLFVKFFRPGPRRRYKWDAATATATASSSSNGKNAAAATSNTTPSTHAIGPCSTGIISEEKSRASSDLESIAPSHAFPVVLVQIPMYNEREVYRLSIGAACSLVWPSDRIVIQVLDDSTDPTVQRLVELECRRWANKGVNINYEVRDNRKGYKAGALKEGMGCDYVLGCEFVAIFDSDFQPQSDFLMQTIPYLMSDPDVALVQTRWDFVNTQNCMLTRMQKMTLDYHFKVEQEAGSSACGFFGFNGTAGVWRISALNEAGGWNDRTTVEDMDLAIRATLRGWKFIYAGDVRVKSELPSNFRTYRNQQHRWTCGAANLFRKMGMEIIATKNVSLVKKAYVIYSFFLVRKVVAHVLTFVFYSVVVPLSVFVPEAQLPVWEIVYIPTTVTFLYAIRNTRCLHLLVFWIVFENVMSFHRMKSTMIGLFEARSATEWIVTEKLGEALLAEHRTSAGERANTKIRFLERVYLSEIIVGIFLLGSASYNLAHEENYYYVYMYLQAVAFLVVGFGYVGTGGSRTETE